MHTAQPLSIAFSFTQLVLCVLGPPEYIIITAVGLLAVYAVVQFVRSHKTWNTLGAGAAFLVAGVVFLIWAPWPSAMPRKVAVEKYPDIQIPEDWDVVLVNHGHASEWHLGTCDENPLSYGVCTLMFFGSLGCLFWLGTRSDHAVPTDQQDGVDNPELEP